MRKHFVLLHRYIGLMMTVFLIIAGFTGIFIAFYDELEALIHPELMIVEPPVNQVALSQIALAKLVQKNYPNSLIRRIPLHQPSEKSVRFFLLPRPDIPKIKLINNEIFLNPYTGTILGQRNWGDITQGSINLMPFIYRLHYSLALGEIGRYALGIIALLWTMDCFIGAYLTFPVIKKNRFYTTPVSQRVNGLSDWLVRWWKSWKVRWSSSFYKINFDLHRAGGLWVWAMLLVLAWSSVSFNLNEVYKPIMKKFFGSQVLRNDLPSLTQPLIDPKLSWETALVVGRKLMQQASTQKGFTIHHEGDISYIPDKGIYVYAVNSSLDISEKLTNTYVMFDANNGSLVSVYLPTGLAKGNTITEWLMALHMANVWGLPMQIFVSTIGFFIVILTISGVYIWWKKRSSRTLPR